MLVCYFITKKNKFLGLVVSEVRLAATHFIFLLGVTRSENQGNSKEAFLVLVLKNRLPIFDFVITGNTSNKLVVEFFVQLAIDIMIDSILTLARLAVKNVGLFTVF